MIVVAAGGHVRRACPLGLLPPDERRTAARLSSVSTVHVDGADRALDVDPDAVVAGDALVAIVCRGPAPWVGFSIEEALLGAVPSEPNVEEVRQSVESPTALVWGPALANRFVFALAHGLRTGLLPPGLPWRVHVHDPSGTAARVLSPVTDLVTGVADAVDPTLAPPEIVTNLGITARREGRFRLVNGELTGKPDLWIDLAPRDRLPDHGDDAAISIRASSRAPRRPPKSRLELGEFAGEADDPALDPTLGREEAAAFAIAEAGAPLAARSRFAALVERAGDRAAAACAAAAREAGRPAWAVDTWKIASEDVRLVLEDQVLAAPESCDTRELGIVLGRRTARAAETIERLVGGARLAVHA